VSVSFIRLSTLGTGSSEPGTTIPPHSLAGEGRFIVSPQGLRCSNSMFGSNSIRELANERTLSGLEILLLGTVHQLSLLFHFSDQRAKVLGGSAENSFKANAPCEIVPKVFPGMTKQLLRICCFMSRLMAQSRHVCCSSPLRETQPDCRWSCARTGDHSCRWQTLRRLVGHWVLTHSRQ